MAFREKLAAAQAAADRASSELKKLDGGGSKEKEKGKKGKSRGPTTAKLKRELDELKRRLDDLALQVGAEAPPPLKSIFSLVRVAIQAYRRTWEARQGSALYLDAQQVLRWLAASGWDVETLVDQYWIVEGML